MNTAVRALDQERFRRVADTSLPPSVKKKSGQQRERPSWEEAAYATDWFGVAACAFFVFMVAIASFMVAMIVYLALLIIPPHVGMSPAFPWLLIAPWLAYVGVVGWDSFSDIR